MTTTILELMRSAPARDTAWLLEALQAAVELEYFTLPPYLTAMWSVKDESHPAARAIRAVVEEEMEHMALACNMLVAVGGAPRIRAAVPKYPGVLPGGVKPGLEVHLAGLSKELLAVFKLIEEPENPLALPERSGLESFGEETFPRIGEFYTAIRDVFRDLALKDRIQIRVDRQITGPLAPMTVANLDEVERAINKITTEGEGSNVSPTSDAPDHFAHYYIFEGLVRGQLPVYDKIKKKPFWGAKLEFPSCHPVAPVPRGGYVYDKVAGNVAALLRAFDETYTAMVNELHAAWNGGGQAALWRAVECMFSLKAPARALMAISIPGSDWTYGPNFHYIARREVP